MQRSILALLLLCVTGGGCGTSKWTDTQRTATEQLLISDAMDRAVSQLDFRALAGKKVYLDTTPLRNSVDAPYLTSTLRQHMLASGCILKDKAEEADYVVEARTGSTGTDHHDLLFGVPQTTIPAPMMLPGAASPVSSIPEIPLAKRMDQRAIVKLALFAYNRQTGRPVWQSGIVTTESKAKHIWLFGAGPFQRGKIYGGTSFAGDRLRIPMIDLERSGADGPTLSVADEAYFIEPPAEATPPAGQVAGQAAAAAPGSASSSPAPAGTPSPPTTQGAAASASASPEATSKAGSASSSAAPPAPAGSVTPASHAAPAAAQPAPSADPPPLLNPFAMPAEALKGRKGSPPDHP